MNDLPSFPTPGQASYAHSHSNQGRKTQPQPSFRPPPANRMPSNSQQQHYQQAPPQFRPQQSQGYGAPAPSDYYRQQQQQSQQYPPQQVYQQAPPPPQPQPMPQQSYSNQGYQQPPQKISYQQQHSPHQQHSQMQQSSSRPPPSHTYGTPPQQSHMQAQYQDGNDYSNRVQKKAPPPSLRTHNKSKESLPESSKSISAKQKLEMELRSVFEKVDTNRSGRITQTELSYALLNFDRTKFQDSTLRLMMNLFGGVKGEYTNTSLTFDQFVSLWKYLSAYKKLFVQADADQSGDISFGEFQKILEQIGYKLDIDLVLHLFSRYCTNTGRSSGGSGEGRGIGRLKFDSFIELLVYLRKLTDVFKKYDKDLSGTATIGFSDFLFEVSNLT